MITPGQHKFIIQCSEYAERAHQGQSRKGGSPYIIHPARVASLVAMSEICSCETICAAWLHDVIEDCCTDVLFNLYTIRNNGSNLNDFLFNNTSQDGKLTLRLVKALTLPEYEEKMKDRQKDDYYKRLRDKANPMACVIKYCSRIDNLSTVDKFSPEGREWYIKDTYKMAELIGNKAAQKSSIISDLFLKTLKETEERYLK